MLEVSVYLFRIATPKFMISTGQHLAAFPDQPVVVDVVMTL